VVSRLALPCRSCSHLPPPLAAFRAALLSGCFCCRSWPLKYTKGLALTTHACHPTLLDRHSLSFLLFSFSCFFLFCALGSIVCFLASPLFFALSFSCCTKPFHLPSSHPVFRLSAEMAARQVGARVFDFAAIAARLPASARGELASLRTAYQTLKTK
jgi:hypothetical protein